MSLEPPEKLRSLQGKLYDKAKAEPGYRFYLLYDKIHRPDVLTHAYALVRRNDGAPGVDGVTFDRIEAAGLAHWLAGLAEELRTKRYRAQPVRRVLIPKPAAASVRSASRRFGTGWRRPRRSWCSSRSSRRTWNRRLTGIGRIAVRSMRSRRFTSDCWRVSRRWSTPICPSTSTAFPTQRSCRAWRGGSATGTCCI